MQLPIEEWKRKYGKVFRLEIAGTAYIFRRLSMGEYRTLSNIDDRIERELYVLRAVLHPENTKDAPSGAVERLVEAILDKTEINEPAILSKLAAARDRLGLEDNILQWKILIIRYLNYTPEQVDAMDIDTFIENLALLESTGLAGQPVVAQGKDDGVSANPANRTGPDLMAIYKRGKEQLYGRHSTYRGPIW